ncbi:MAG: metallophosphoesterase family protein [Anaerolineales bacterium]|nr:metallophosphoesterase family protein [Chloroflexota bacterium]MBL6981506.1 metallophosphoesterase family protein [Anaerolineales bacterium]
MKIAVLADIHANYPALLEVAEHLQGWGPDLVFVAGDTVNRGPRPAECLRLVQEKVRNEGWKVIRGNHEDYVIVHSQDDAPREGPLFDLFYYSYWTYEKLGCDTTDLEGLPEEFSQTVANDGEFRGVHASMRGNRRGIYPEMADSTLKKLIAPPPAVLAVGHTHRPLVRKIDETLVVNAGSVGLPFDGNHRAAYAQIQSSNGDWTAKIIRLPYDIAQTKQDYVETGFVDDAGPLARLIRLELEHSLSQLYQWMNRYMDLVLAGEISVAAAADEYLQNPLIKPYW